MKNKFKYDLHTHTKEGSFNAPVSVYDLVRILVEKEYDGLLITDHNSYNGYKFYIDNMKYLFKGISVIKGIEYDTKEGRVIIVMPSNTNSNIFTCPGLHLRQAIDIVHEYGGIIGLCYSPNKHLDQTIISELDFIESDKSSNLPLIKGSNNHGFKSIGKYYTYLENKINNEDDLIAYIKAKKETMIDDNKFNYSYIKSISNKFFSILKGIIFLPKRIILLRKI